MGLGRRYAIDQPNLDSRTSPYGRSAIGQDDVWRERDQVGRVSAIEFGIAQAPGLWHWRRSGESSMVASLSRYSRGCRKVILFIGC
jgi:hypothetical protein